MNRRARVLAIGLGLGLGLGCGDDPQAIDGGVDPPDDAIDAPVDASPIPIDAAPICFPERPPGQQGCGGGARCAWIVTATSPVQGTLGCLPPGTVPPGGACTVGPPGATTGFDDCVAGAACVAGVCQDICGFSGADAACTSATTCTVVAGLFAGAGEAPVAGVCRRGCDVVGQTDCPPDQGCYLLVSPLTSRAVCAEAGELGPREVITGQVFANSCRPGYMPRRRDQETSVMECGALCRPADVTSTTNVASEGGVAPHACGDRGAAPPGDALDGESCRYWWAREPTPGSDYSNTVGWCFRHAAFRHDVDGDGTLDAPTPRCIALTTGDVLPPIHDPPESDAEGFWCTALLGL